MSKKEHNTFIDKIIANSFYPAHTTNHFQWYNEDTAKDVTIQGRDILSQIPDIKVKQVKHIQLCDKDGKRIDKHLRVTVGSPLDKIITEAFKLGHTTKIGDGYIFP